MKIFALSILICLAGNRLSAQLMPALHQGMWGLQDSAGRMIVLPEYDTIIPFYQYSEAMPMVLYLAFQGGINKPDRRIDLIRTDGSTAGNAFTDFAAIFAAIYPVNGDLIGKQWLNADNLLSKEKIFFNIEKDGMIIPRESPYPNTALLEKSFWVRKDDKWGAVNVTGTSIIDPSFDEVQPDNNFSVPTWKATKNNTIFLIKNGNKITNTGYGWIGDQYEFRTGDPLFLVSKGEKFGVADTSLNEIIPVKYDTILPFYFSSESGEDDYISVAYSGGEIQHSTFVTENTTEVPVYAEDGTEHWELWLNTDTMIRPWFKGGTVDLYDRKGKSIANGLEYFDDLFYETEYNHSVENYYLYPDAPLLFKQNKKWGIRSIEKVLLPAVHDSIVFIYGGSDENLLFHTHGDSAGLYEISGQALYHGPVERTSRSWFLNNEPFYLIKGKYYKSEKPVNASFEDLTELPDSLTAYDINEAIQFDMQGNEYLEYYLDNVLGDSPDNRSYTFLHKTETGFLAGYRDTTLRELTGFLDRKGEIKIPFNYQDLVKVFSFEKDDKTIEVFRALESDKNAPLYGLIDSEGKILLPFEYKDIQATDTSDFLKVEATNGAYLFDPLSGELRMEK